MLLQLGAAAVTEVMHEPAELPRPAARVLSGRLKHKVKDVCSNLSQRNTRGHVLSRGCKQLRQQPRHRCTALQGWAAEEHPVPGSPGILLLFLPGCAEDTVTQPFIPLENTGSTSQCLIQTNVLRLSRA